ncbi:hypothetical protein EYF80_051280 [Liparis tanakae]|uniref:Uncharacterized protein n=1 Tax=Liparis tanakae TaxID=230148 RepID=A0A4Z2FCD6_9TELE|nr:hypothetical protein EYF80_051280 [Liparis tanakae]
MTARRVESGKIETRQRDNRASLEAPVDNSAERLSTGCEAQTPDHVTYAADRLEQTIRPELNAPPGGRRRPERLATR